MSLSHSENGPIRIYCNNQKCLVLRKNALNGNRPRVNPYFWLGRPAAAVYVQRLHCSRQKYLNRFCLRRDSYEKILIVLINRIFPSIKTRQLSISIRKFVLNIWFIDCVFDCPLPHVFTYLCKNVQRKKKSFKTDFQFFYILVFIKLNEELKLECVLRKRKILQE